MNFLNVYLLVKCCNEDFSTFFNRPLIVSWHANVEGIADEGQKSIVSISDFFSLGHFMKSLFVHVFVGALRNMLCLYRYDDEGRGNTKISGIFDNVIPCNLPKSYLDHQI